MNILNLDDYSETEWHRLNAQELETVKYEVWKQSRRPFSKRLTTNKKKALENGDVYGIVTKINYISAIGIFHQGLKQNLIYAIHFIVPDANMQRNIITLKINQENRLAGLEEGKKFLCIAFGLENINNENRMSDNEYFSFLTAESKNDLMVDMDKNRKYRKEKEKLYA